MLKKFLVFLVAAMFWATAVSAAGITPCGGPGQPACTICHFFVLIYRVLIYSLSLVSLIAGFILLGSGFALAVNQGNPASLKKTKKFIFVVIAGFAIIFLGWVLVNTFLLSFGIAEWDGFSLEKNWWKVKTTCPAPVKEKPICGDGLVQKENDEECDPEETIQNCQNRTGLSKESCGIVNARCQSGSCKIWPPLTNDEITQGDDDGVDKGNSDDSKNSSSDNSVADNSIIDECTRDNGKKLIEPGAKFTLYRSDIEPRRPRCEIICELMKNSVFISDCAKHCEPLDKMAYTCDQFCENVESRSKSECARLCGEYTGDLQKTVFFTCNEVCVKNGKVCVGVGLDDPVTSRCAFISDHAGTTCRVFVGSVNYADCKTVIQPITMGGCQVPASAKGVVAPDTWWFVHETGCYCK